MKHIYNCGDRVACNGEFGLITFVSRDKIHIKWDSKESNYWTKPNVYRISEICHKLKKDKLYSFLFV